MSTESLKKRLEAATPPVPGAPQIFDAAVAMHAYADLTAALKVIEALNEMPWITKPVPLNPSGQKLAAALKEFEALP